MLKYTQINNDGPRPMYNLLMTAGEGNWNQPTWTLGIERFLEYTNPGVAARFESLNDEAIQALISIPTLFTYEDFLEEAAHVGRITNIERRTRDLRITFALDPTVPPIPFNTLRPMYPDLDITQSWEGSRTHWAVKDVDLPNVLRAAGFITSPQLNPQPRPPKVFVSYSWDSPDHSQWVAWLAGHLRSQGIDVVLDQWYVHGGMDLAQFMTSALRDSD